MSVFLLFLFLVNFACIMGIVDDLLYALDSVIFLWLLWGFLFFELCFCFLSWYTAKILGFRHQHYYSCNRQQQEGSDLSTFQLLLFSGSLAVIPRRRFSTYLGIAYIKILWHLPFWDFTFHVTVALATQILSSMSSAGQTAGFCFLLECSVLNGWISALRQQPYKYISYPVQFPSLEDVFPPLATCFWSLSLTLMFVFIYCPQYIIVICGKLPCHNLKQGIRILKH